MNFVHKYICVLLAVLLTGYFFYTKDFSNKYDKSVIAEGHGYYAYLPATFIYHDYTFNFFNEVSKKYYYPSYNPPTGNFIREANGIRANKYYPGVSLLWLPFFLIAHFLALIFHLPADGYSDIYQYGIGLAGIFYTFLGLLFTKKILTHYKIADVIQTITLAILLFGTNLLMYASTWSSQTHCYSFFLIAGFTFFAIRLFNNEYENRNRSLMMLMIFLALIVTVRPQNIFIILLLPFFGLTRANFSTIVKRNLLSVGGIAGMLIALLLIARVCYYWYVQTGKLFIDAYPGEHYYLTKPHVLEVLFGFRGGWIIYSPFIAVALAGIFFFKRASEKINLLVFWSMVIYVSSCWWCWTYGSTSFGQRPMIDFYSIIALQGAVFFTRFHQRKLKWLPIAVALVAIPLCLLQTHQYKHGIIAGENETAEYYRENFFEIHPVSIYPVPAKYITNIESHTFTFDEAKDSSHNSDIAYSGKGASCINGTQPVGEKKFFVLPAYMTAGSFSIIRTTAMINRTSDDGNELLMVDFIRDGKVISSNPFYMKYFTHKKKWTKFQCGLEVPDDVIPGDSVSIYFQRTEGNDAVYIDDLNIEFIHTDSSYQFSM